METALNLLWLLVTTLLCGGCVLAARRGQLRLSLRSALTCSVLLAVLLFPAISMTDDLQSANAEVELRARHLLEVLTASVALADAAGLILFLTLALILSVRQRLAARSLLQSRLPARSPRFRPAAIRPPTAFVFAR